MYYWTCCGILHISKDLCTARIELEQHEALLHKGSTIGSFGWKKT